MDYQQLAAEMDKASKQLQELDVSVAPTDAELASYEVLRRAAHDMLTVTNYVIDGD